MSKPDFLTGCTVCGGDIVVKRDIGEPVHLSPLWADRWVCDSCADRSDRMMRAKRLRDLRKTRRRWRCIKCAARYSAPRGTKPGYCPSCAKRFAACPECHHEFETHFGKYAHCVVCEEIVEIRERLKEWDDALPAAYRWTKAEKLPDPAAAAAVAGWDESDLCGLYVFGPTGAGKTRSVLLRLRSLIEEGSTVRYLRSAEFARELIERTKPGGKGKFEGWLDDLRRVEILCLDEVEKLKFSERVEAEFFDLVETRLAARRATIFVSNVRSDAISERMSEPYAAPFLRRVLEFCHPVAFRVTEPRARKATA